MPILHDAAPNAPVEAAYGVPPSRPLSLTIQHLTFEAAAPVIELSLGIEEGLLYALAGRLRLYWNGQYLGLVGGRAGIETPAVHVVRFPAGVDHDIILTLDGAAADCLWVTCDTAPCVTTKLPYGHGAETFFHTVGVGTHTRRVGDVATPPGFVLSCGETWQGPGTTSSWPSHATEADLTAYAAGTTTWAERFFVVCPQPGRVEMDGWSTEMREGTSPVRIRRVQSLENGCILAMPFGSHPVTSAPDAWLYYAWAYRGTALRKVYRKFSTDVRTYRS